MTTSHSHSVCQTTAIRGIGESKASALKAAGYDTVEQLAAASTSDLQEVDGIGNKLATQIKESSPVVTFAKTEEQRSDEPIGERRSNESDDQQYTTEQQTSDTQSNTSGTLPWNISLIAQTADTQSNTSGMLPWTVSLVAIILGTGAWWCGFIAGFIFPEGSAEYETMLQLPVLAWFLLPPTLYLDSRTVRSDSDWDVSILWYIAGALSIIGTGLTGLVYLIRRRKASA